MKRGRFNHGVFIVPCRLMLAACGL